MDKVHLSIYSKICPNLSNKIIFIQFYVTYSYCPCAISACMPIFFVEISIYSLILNWNPNENLKNSYPIYKIKFKQSSIDQVRNISFKQIWIKKESNTFIVFHKNHIWILIFGFTNSIILFPSTPRVLAQFLGSGVPTPRVLDGDSVRLLVPCPTLQK